MKISAEQATGSVPVTVLTVQGDLDASSYQALIAAAREQVAAGAQRILLDLSGVPYISSAGLVALHSTAVLVQGQQPPDPEAGWSTFHSMGRDADKGKQTVVKLLSPSERVAKVLDTSGMVKFFDIYTDKAAAIASFS